MRLGKRGGESSREKCVGEDSRAVMVHTLTGGEAGREQRKRDAKRKPCLGIAVGSIG